MYSAVAERSREIATMRALGIGAGSVVLSFLIEALLILLLGGRAGVPFGIPLNGLTRRHEFSRLLASRVCLRVTPDLLLGYSRFALFMGSSAACHAFELRGSGC